MVACEKSRRSELFEEKTALLQLKSDQEKVLGQVMQATPNPTEEQKQYINRLETELKSTRARIGVVDHELAITP